MLSATTSGTLIGIQALPVQVEVNAGESGEPRVVIVGLPDAAVKESSDRVISAISNSGYYKPFTHITINLAPGHIRKEGPLFDLPIALGLLAATGQVELPGLANWLIAGELALSGECRPVKGALSLALLARAEGKQGILLPAACAGEAALTDHVPVYPVHSLREAVEFLSGQKEVPAAASPLPELREGVRQHFELDFSEVKGQHSLRRAVEVAVAGSHNLLMVGPPGSGKSMIAKRIPTIMPEPSLDEFLEILSIHSAAGGTISRSITEFARPFRSPHHTISDVGLLGGGSIPGPGEISLAHNGVLFLDEFPEFRRSALEVLRQPLEDGEVTISRSAAKVTLPSSFMLVAAMNPCPCGYLGDKDHHCKCTPTQIRRYRSRISGPLMDRIDLHVEAPAISMKELSDTQAGESSQAMRERIENCRKIQQERFDGESVNCNAQMIQKHIKTHCAIQPSHLNVLHQAMTQLSLSARAYHRILKVARTLADLSGAANIDLPHLMEAIQYRSLDRADH